MPIITLIGMHVTVTPAIPGKMVSALQNNALLLTNTLVPEQMNRRPAQPVAVNTNLAVVTAVTLGTMVNAKNNVLLLTNIPVRRLPRFPVVQVQLVAVSTNLVAVTAVTPGTALRVSAKAQAPVPVRLAICGILAPVSAINVSTVLLGTSIPVRRLRARIFPAVCTTPVAVCIGYVSVKAAINGIIKVIA